MKLLGQLKLHPLHHHPWHLSQLSQFQTKKHYYIAYILIEIHHGKEFAANECGISLKLEIDA